MYLFVDVKSQPESIALSCMVTSTRKPPSAHRYCVCMMMSVCVFFFSMFLTAVLLHRSTVWMMCAACCPSLILTFPIKSTVSGSLSSYMLGTHFPLQQRPKTKIYFSCGHVLWLCCTDLLISDTSIYEWAISAECSIDDILWDCVICHDKAFYTVNELFH